MPGMTIGAMARPRSSGPPASTRRSAMYAMSAPSALAMVAADSARTVLLLMARWAALLLNSTERKWSSVKLAGPSGSDHVRAVA